jgi:hypothetical protein
MVRGPRVDPAHLLGSIGCIMTRHSTVVLATVSGWSRWQSELGRARTVPWLRMHSNAECTVSQSSVRARPTLRCQSLYLYGLADH